eukprot:CAMPEP_0178696364 /NCGR_PEP_ID=MMETSP0699-20121125/9368_1 /TAXON_ID=265572 /ORGANISM="Extubocellulus spinifer, Strain CCMP396" /LENGTH=32 /DNA_ID= /DNA_START= /DNA_END= /DNA_ORIENTATION=
MPHADATSSNYIRCSLVQLDVIPADFLIDENG